MPNKMDMIELMFIIEVDILISDWFKNWDLEFKYLSSKVQMIRKELLQ